ncbi:MAG: helix-turn-helix transcriptional regulator [Bacillota bacterium]
MDNLQIFTLRLNELLSDKNMSAYALTRALDIPHSTAQAWFVGKSFPTVDYLIKLAKFFNCSIDYLVGITNY